MLGEDPICYFLQANGLPGKIGSRKADADKEKYKMQRTAKRPKTWVDLFFRKKRNRPIKARMKKSASGSRRSEK